MKKTKSAQPLLLGKLGANCELRDHKQFLRKYFTHQMSGASLEKTSPWDGRACIGYQKEVESPNWATAHDKASFETTRGCPRMPCTLHRQHKSQKTILLGRSCSDLLQKKQKVS